MKKTLKIAVLLCLAMTVMLFAAACDKTPDEELGQNHIKPPQKEPPLVEPPHSTSTILAIGHL